MSQPLRRPTGLWCLMAGFLLLAAVPVTAAQFTVTDNEDSGAGSLRQAVLVEGVDLVGAYLGDFGISGDGCTGAVLLVNQECSIEVTGMPSVLGPRTASLLVASNASNRPAVDDPSLEGAQGSVGVSRERIVFPPIGRVGVTTDIVGVLFSNTGTVPVTFGSPTIEGDHPDEFSLTDDTCSGQTVAPGNSCFIEMNATPAEEGRRTANLVLTSDAPDSPYTVELISEGVLPEVELQPSNPQFSFIQGDDTDRNRTSRLVVSNPTRVDLVIESIGSPEAPFTITGGSCMELALPASLPPFGDCEILLRFEAEDIGGYGSSFQITTDAASSPDQVTLRGNIRPRVVPVLGVWGLGILALLIGVIGLRKTG